MFGRGFGETAFGDDPTLYLRITIKLSTYINFEYRIFVSTIGLITQGNDVPALQPYDETLLEPLDFTWSMSNDQEGIFGGFITGRGTTTIDNLDGIYDNLTQFYTTDGRPVEVRLGKVGTPQSSWPVVFKGLSSGEFIDDQTFQITDEDLAYKLDVPAQSRTYGGTGDLDGTADLAGKPIPLCFGWCPFLQGALVVPNEFLYQVHDGPIQAISAVYDQAVLLTFYQDYSTVAALRSASIPSGYYGTCLAFGFFRLNEDVTPDGAVTADVQGDSTNGFVETTGAILRALIKRSSKLNDPADLFLPSFVSLEKLQPAPIGIYISTEENPTVADVCGQLMLGIGGFVGFRREGKLYVGRVDAPLGPPVKRFTDADIDANPQKQQPPEGIWPPPSIWKIGYQKNYTVMNNPAGGATDDIRSFVATDYRYATASAPAVKIDHPFGKDPDPVPAFFRDLADAQTEANRRLALYRIARGLYSLNVTDRSGALLNVGDQIWVQHPRGDLKLGRNLLIIEVHHQAKAHKVTIEAYG